MPTFTDPMASPKNWRGIYRIAVRSDNQDAGEHLEALLSHQIGRFTSGLTMLKPAKHLVNGKATS